MKVIQSPYEVRGDSFVIWDINGGLQSSLNIFNCALILSRNLLFGCYTTYKMSHFTFLDKPQSSLLLFLTKILVEVSKKISEICLKTQVRPGFFSQDILMLFRQLH